MLGCTAIPSAFGLADWDCSTRVATIVLYVTLDLPRLILIFPAIALSLTRHAVIGHNAGWLLDGIPFLLPSLPFIAIAWFGPRYWLRSRRAVGLFAGLLLLSDALLLAAEV